MIDNVKILKPPLDKDGYLIDISIAIKAMIDAKKIPGKYLNNFIK